jgi:hypothetical protein
MNKFTDILFRILGTIIAVPLGIIGAVCLTPLIVICLIFAIPIAIFEDIWFPPDIYEIEENKESEE